MLFEKLKELFPQIKQNEPLKHHSTFRCGGPADLFYALKNIEELPSLIQWAEENSVRWFIFGMGSNILFADEGFRGLVIKNTSSNIQILKDASEEPTVICCDSGTILATLIKFSLENGLTGLEELYGVPGTVGGATFGNAGVPGTEIGNFVEKISVFSIDKGVYEMNKEELAFAYRESKLKTNAQKHLPLIVLRIYLKLKSGDTNKAKARIKEVDEKRRSKQPGGMTGGSFFKNPSPDKPAGMLIDEAGCKGMNAGGAAVNEKHANFITNTGDAKTSDILDLTRSIQKIVQEKHEINLEPEVRIIDQNGHLVAL